MATRGQKRHLVTLYSPSAPVPDGDGGYTEGWDALSPSTRWAEIKPATARDLERVAAGTVLSTATHVITMDYHAQVGVETRIVFENRTFSITGVSDPEERHRDLVIVAVELLDVVPTVVTAPSWMQPGFAQ